MCPAIGAACAWKCGGPVCAPIQDCKPGITKLGSTSGTRSLEITPLVDATEGGPRVELLLVRCLSDDEARVTACVSPWRCRGDEDSTATWMPSPLAMLGDGFAGHTCMIVAGCCAATVRLASNLGGLLPGVCVVDSFRKTKTSLRACIDNKTASRFSYLWNHVPHSAFYICLTKKENNFFLYFSF